MSMKNGAECSRPTPRFAGCHTHGPMFQLVPVYSPIDNPCGVYESRRCGESKMNLKDVGSPNLIDVPRSWHENASDTIITNNGTNKGTQNGLQEVRQISVGGGDAAAGDVGGATSECRMQLSCSCTVVVLFPYTAHGLTMLFDVRSIPSSHLACSVK